MLFLEELSMDAEVRECVGSTQDILCAIHKFL